MAREDLAKHYLWGLPPFLVTNQNLVVTLSRAASDQSAAEKISFLSLVKDSDESEAEAERDLGCALAGGLYGSCP